LKKANNILALFNLPEKVRFVDNDHSGCRGRHDSRHYSRRELFTYLSQGVWNKVAPTKESADIAAKSLNRARARLNPRLSEKRRILLQSLKALGEPAIGKVESEDLPFLQIEMAGKCDGCGLCTILCPSRALRQYDSSGKRAIEFSSAYCLACNLCVEICPRGALKSSTCFSTDDLVTGKKRVLMEQEHSACARCGRISIAPMAGGLCPNCQKTKEIKEWLIRQHQR
jgi:formate hydrogenlyase subunit 6/NADH:ubiquinone oxidoreductase subunit I